MVDNKRKKRKGSQPNTPENPYGLNQRELTFVELYMQGGSIVSAAWGAGFKGGRMKATDQHYHGYADRVFKKPYIQMEIRRRQNDRAFKADITQEQMEARAIAVILTNWGRVVQKVIEAGGDLSVLTEEELYCIDKIECKEFTEKYFDDETGEYDTRLVRNWKLAPISRTTEQQILARTRGWNQDNLKLGEVDVVAAILQKLPKRKKEGDE